MEVSGHEVGVLAVAGGAGEGDSGGGVASEDVRSWVGLRVDPPVGADEAGFDFSLDHGARLVELDFELALGRDGGSGSRASSGRGGKGSEGKHLVHHCEFGVCGYGAKRFWRE